LWVAYLYNDKELQDPLETTVEEGLEVSIAAVAEYLFKIKGSVAKLGKQKRSFIDLLAKKDPGDGKHDNWLAKIYKWLENNSTRG
jgi:hypothetical protein